MKHTFFAGVLALFVWAIAPHSVQAQDFSGTYFGGHFGYRWVDADLTSPAYMVDSVAIPPRDESYDTDGIIVGVQLGHMARISPNWYLGLEADISAGWGSRDRQVSFGDGPEDEYQTYGTGRSGFDTNWQGTIRARLGYASGIDMFYFTGGFAFMDIDWNDAIAINFGATYTANKSDILTGWVIGGGWERLISPNWLLRVEYLYEDFGSISVPLAGTDERGSLDVTAQKLRLGLSYKF